MGAQLDHNQAIISTIDLGLADYREVYLAQRDLVCKRRANRITDQLILVEHEAVYTFGRKSDTEASEGLPNSVQIERGGEATYHNPGQLVCYPILQLSPMERDIPGYLRNLEEVIIRVLADFGVEAGRKPKATGVWVEGLTKKIASIGVAVSGWVTYHGTALNVYNDLKGFSQIQPCGFSSEVMTSMETCLGEKCPTMNQVKDTYLRRFGEVFDRFIEPMIRKETC